MLQILGKIPKEPFAVACSGGIDSMVLVDFLRKFPKYQFKLLYFNHGTKHGQEAQEFLEKFASQTGSSLEIGKISRNLPEKGSHEEFWRNERYKFLEQFNLPIATAHNLNDCVETWVFSSLRGFPKIIPYRRNQVFRPFLMVSKTEINEWASSKKVEYVQDPSNDSIEYTRNLIRHELMPSALKVNPGIENMMRRLIRDRGI
jgi:tRNA(Ile)-lysidine synthase